MTSADSTFTGSIPDIYDRYLVPLLFEHFADDLARRVGGLRPPRLLEVAAGTGAVTRRLASVVPPSSIIIATDLNQAMLDRAALVGTPPAVEWRQADAMSLPFENGSFDAVICQFGVMFFPDRPRAFAEARRVLRGGGRFIFNVWDRLEENEFSLLASQTLAKLFPDDPPTFLQRVPFGYHDEKRIAADLASGGFTVPPRITTVSGMSHAPSGRSVAVGLCEGSPIRNEIEARDAARLGAVTDEVTNQIASRFGSGAVAAKMQALVIEVDA